MTIAFIYHVYIIFIKCLIIYVLEINFKTEELKMIKMISVYEIERVNQDKGTSMLILNMHTEKFNILQYCLFN